MADVVADQIVVPDSLGDSFDQRRIEEVVDRAGLIDAAGQIAEVDDEAVDQRRRAAGRLRIEEVEIDIGTEIDVGDLRTLRVDEDLQCGDAVVDDRQSRRRAPAWDCRRRLRR